MVNCKQELAGITTSFGVLHILCDSSYVFLVLGFIFLALFAVEKMMKVSQLFSGQFIIFFLVLFKCTLGGGKKNNP